MFTISQRKNPHAGGAIEDNYTLSMKAQKFIVSALAKRIAETGKPESVLIKENEVSTSAIRNFKTLDQDRDIMATSLTRIAAMLGLVLPDLLNAIAQESNGAAKIEDVEVISSRSTALVPVSANQRIFAIGKGMTVLQNGKVRIVLHDEVNVNLHKGNDGETIVDLI